MFILSMMYLFKIMAYEWEPDTFKLCQAGFSTAITHYCWDALQLITLQEQPIIEPLDGNKSQTSFQRDLQLFFFFLSQFNKPVRLNLFLKNIYSIVETCMASFYRLLLFQIPFTFSVKGTHTNTILSGQNWKKLKNHLLLSLISFHEKLHLQRCQMLRSKLQKQCHIMNQTFGNLIIPLIKRSNYAPMKNDVLS